MRKIRYISPEEENFRVEKLNGNVGRIRRDPIKPEPVGTVVLLPFKIIGYDKDCDGSLMARLEQIEVNGSFTGFSPSGLGLSPDSGFVVLPEELKQMCLENKSRKDL